MGSNSCKCMRVIHLKQCVWPVLHLLEYRRFTWHVWLQWGKSQHYSNQEQQCVTAQREIPDQVALDTVFKSMLL